MPAPIASRAASGSYPPPDLLNRTPWSDAAAASKDRLLNIAPLAVCVNIPLQSGAGGFPAALYDALGREIAGQPDCHRQRPVSQLMWRNPFYRAGLGDLTAAMHKLGSHFRLLSEAHEYCAEVDIFQTTEEQVALLRGLGFNQLLMTFTPAALASDLHGGSALLAKRMRALRDYGFTSLGIKLVYGFDAQKPQQLRRLIATIIELQPERVYLNDALERYHWDPLAAACASSNDLQDHFTLLFDALRSAGYRVLGNDCFVLPGDALAGAQHRSRLRRTLLNYNASNAADLLGLGPGAYCQLDRLYRRNEPDPEAYCDKVARGEPLAVAAHYLDERGQLLRLVIDQLLCYHRVDIGYIDSRYKLQLTALLKQAIAWLAGRLSGDPSSLARFNEGACMHLTAAGILHLRAICNAVASQGLGDRGGL